MILSFSDPDTEAFFKSRARPKTGWQSLAKVVARKLDMVHAASRLNDLKAPPSNKLEALKDDRAGQHSIRVNDKWRVCFVWTDAGPRDVEIADYHD